MTDSEQPEQVSITPIMERVIRHMLGDARARYNLTGICKTLGLYPGTVSPLLRRMLDAGWIEEKGGGNKTVKYYRFTYGTSTMLRKAIGPAAAE